MTAGAFQEARGRRAIGQMRNHANLLGAVVAHVIYASSIVTFLSRLTFKTPPGHWYGLPILLMGFPLAYLLVKAPQLQRPVLYYLQIGLMLLFILALFVLDYALKIQFRQTQWMVIGFVVLYFAGIGGMIGVAARAGRGWMISAVVLFFMTAALAFAQRAITGY